MALVSVGALAVSLGCSEDGDSAAAVADSDTQVDTDDVTSDALSLSDASDDAGSDVPNTEDVELLDSNNVDSSSDGDASEGDVDTPDTDDPVDTADLDVVPPSDTVATDVAAPWQSCTADADCTDPHACTTDRCDPEGYCVWTVSSGCLIANVCVETGTIRPTSPCEACLPESSPTAWSVRADDAPCTGTCEAIGRCDAGVCSDLGPACDDDNVCTSDTCAQGDCTHASANGLVCDDGVACTTGDTCLSGLCAGAPIDCDDDDPCTADSCSEGACSNVVAPLPCDDGDPCTGPDVCTDGTCGAGPQSCDDLNACTVDFCHPIKGCEHLPTENPCCLGVTSLCNDGNDCTIDDCDPSGGCTNAPRLGACDDDDACTGLDACTAGQCTGAPVTCNDGDPCTIDACKPQSGCFATASSGAPCDDGVECTTDDFCVAGVCEGDSAGCQCVPTLAPLGVHIAEMRLGVNGQPGEGLDLDKNAGTCQPASDCSAGIDNAFGPLAFLVNAPIEEAVSEGSLTFLIELGAPIDGPTRVVVHTGEAEGACATLPCSFWVDLTGFHPESCQALYEMSATWSGTALATTGAKADIPFLLPLGGGSVLQLTLQGAQVRATATTSGGTLQTLDGILAGSVSKGELLAAIAKVPPEILPADPALVASLIEGVIAADVDANGDGIKESASVALIFKGKRATLALP